MSANLKGIIQAILTNDKLSEEEKSELIYEFIKEVKGEYLDLKNHTTKCDVKEIGLNLTKEIEDNIKEFDLELTIEMINQIEAELIKKIENTIKEIKEFDLELTKEIESIKKRD